MSFLFKRIELFQILWEIVIVIIQILQNKKVKMCNILSWFGRCFSDEGPRWLKPKTSHIFHEANLATVEVQTRPGWGAADPRAGCVRGPDHFCCPFMDFVTIRSAVCFSSSATLSICFVSLCIWKNAFRKPCSLMRLTLLPVAVFLITRTPVFLSLEE